MARVETTQDFSAHVGKVYAHLAEHENLEALFGARITRVRDGDTTRNGVGSVRELKLTGLPAFQETVTAAVPDELIEYRITKGSPLRGHVGTMRFTPQGDGSRLHYVIDFGAVLPGLDRVIAVGLGRTVRRGLSDLAKTL